MQSQCGYETFRLLQTLRNLADKAEKYRKDGDEECSFIFYKKYAKMLTELKKTTDYKTASKSMVSSVIGTNADFRSSR
jgi:hypothetical protein